MYDAQVKIVQAAIEALRSEAPSLSAELENEQRAAATGLEYYGITSSKFKQLLQSQSITEETKKKLKEGIRAVEYMYQS